MKKRRRTRLEIYQEEQVILSEERTMLSLMRTGLAFIGVGIIIVSIWKEPLQQAISYILIIIGFLSILESYRRLRRKQKEISKLEKKL